MRAFGRLFHDDGVWILWTGAVWKGRTAIEEGHAAVHKTVFRNSIQRERLEEQTFVGPDAAVVRFYSTLTGDERAPDKIIRSRKFAEPSSRSCIRDVVRSSYIIGQQLSQVVREVLDWLGRFLGPVDR